MSQGQLQTDSLTQNRLELKSAVMCMDNNLHDDDVESLKFLCQGLVVASKLKRIDTVHELIGLLQNANVVSENNFFLLADLLQYIRRVDVLESIGYDEAEVMFQRRQNMSQIKPFYVLLFEISEDLTTEDVEKARYMYGNVPRSQNLSSGLDLFTLMIKHQAIHPGDVRQLVSIFQSLKRQDIVELVNRYVATQGRSVMDDLEETFRRSMTLRGINGNAAAGPPRPARIGAHDMPQKRTKSGLGPSIHDFDVIGRNKELPLPCPASEHTSLANHPPSIPCTSPSDPSPSVPQASQTSTGRNQLPGRRQEAAVAAVPENFDGRIISWQLLDILAKKIPAQYWPTFTNRLGLHLLTQSWDMNTADHKYNIALLKRWLDLPETQRLDPVRARIVLVQALHYAGPTLLAQEIAELLNVNRDTALQESMSSQASVYENNEISSNASATHVSVESMNQTASAGSSSGEPQASPVAHLSLEASSSPIPHYRMNRVPRGFCVIINNRDFYAHMPQAINMPDREGTDVDKAKLEDTFRNLNFHVISKDNCTDTEMIHTMNSIAAEDHSRFDCFVCCILTHGTHGGLYGCNGMTVPIRDVTSPFRSQACPGLADKPKLFFMQACQGSQKQEGFSHDIQRDSAVQTDGPVEMIPNEADFLLGYATVPGFVSYRSKTLGSWYITKLTELLNKHAYSHDILDILTLVNFEVGKGNAIYDGGHYKQSPAPMYSLRKKLIFRRNSQQ